MVPVDITFHPSWWCKNAGMDFSERFYNDPEYRIEADIHMRKVLFEKFGDLGFGEKRPGPRPVMDSDMLAGEYLQSQILGCEIVFSSNTLPFIAARNMAEEDIEKLEAPDLRENPAWQAIEKQMRYLEDKYGYIESYIDLHGVQNLALDIRGYELFEDYFINEKVAFKTLDVCAQVIEDVALRLRKITQSIGVGVTSIIRQIDKNLFVTSNCTVEMVSNETYEKFLGKYDAHLAEIFKPFGIHHCGRSVEHVIEGYSKVPGVSFIEAGAFSNLETSRKYFPDTYINARYSPARLKEASTDEIKKEIREMAMKAKPLNLLSFSCVGIDDGTGDDKIRCFVESVRELSTI